MENIIAIRERSTSEADLAFSNFMALAESEMNIRAKENVKMYQTISTEHKTIAQMGGIPFREWFETEVKLQINSRCDELP